MNHKLLSLFVLFILGLPISNLQAQSILIKEISGVQTPVLLENIKKISFSDGDLILEEIDSSASFYPLNEIQHLIFGEFIIDTKLFAESNSISFITYPNPVDDLLYIDFNESFEEASISIFSIQGKLMCQQKVSTTKNICIDLTHLPEGIYLCHYVSLSETKTTKIIKQ